MEILRVPPYPINTKWDVPEANHAYTIYVEDVVDHSIETLSVTSDSNSQVTYTLPRSKVQFDRDFLFRIYDLDIFGEIVVDSNLTVYRPYVDPNLLGTTESEILEYKRLEIIARSIIDAYLGNDSATGEGFYNHKLIVQTTGQGNDYIPMWHNPKKILRVYENNQLVFNGEDVSLALSLQVPVLANGTTVTLSTNVDHGFAVGDTVLISNLTPSSYNGYQTITAVPTSTQFSFANSSTGSITTEGTVRRVWSQNYVIAPDNSAIMRLESGEYNRLEQKPAQFPLAWGDLGYYGRGSIGFPQGYDYIFVLDVGYKAVPPDVEQAAMMLIDDLKCGRNDFYKKFVTEYSTDQFDMKFAPQFLGGTGNNIVDKILDGYRGNVIKPGII